MRTIACLIFVVAIAGFFIAHRSKEEPKPAPQTQNVANAPHENNPHDWMKNSLDRAADVKRQVQQQRKENGGAY